MMKKSDQELKKYIIEGIKFVFMARNIKWSLDLESVVLNMLRTKSGRSDLRKMLKSYSKNSDSSVMKVIDNIEYLMSLLYVDCRLWGGI